MLYIETVEQTENTSNVGNIITIDKSVPVLSLEPTLYVESDQIFSKAPMQDIVVPVNVSTDIDVATIDNIVFGDGTIETICIQSAPSKT